MSPHFRQRGLAGLVLPPGIFAGNAAALGGLPIDFEAESDTLFAAMAAAGASPGMDDRARYNSLISGLKARSVWSKLDLLYVFAGLHEQTSAPKLNWKLPGTYTLTAVAGGLTFSSDGAAGNGTTTAGNTGWIPATHGVSYALDSSHIGVWYADLAAANVVDVGASNDTLNGRSTSDIQGGRQQNATTVASSTANTVVRHKCLLRVNATTIRFYDAGRKIGTDRAQTSAAGLSAEAVYIGGRNVTGTLTTPSSKKMKAVHLGSGGATFTAADVASVEASLDDFFTVAESTADSQADFSPGPSVGAGGVGAIERGGFIYTGGIRLENGNVCAVKISKSTRKIVEQFTLSTIFVPDLHMAPTFDFLSDGRLITAHTGHNSNLAGPLFRRSTDATLLRLGAEVTIGASLNTTYTKFIQSTTGLYLIHREGIGDSFAWEVYRSSDNGDTWTRKKRIINDSAGKQGYLTLPTNPGIADTTMVGFGWAQPIEVNKLVALTWDRATDTLTDSTGVKGTLNDATPDTALCNYNDMGAIRTPAVGKALGPLTVTADGLAMVFYEQDFADGANRKYYLMVRNAGGGTFFEAGGWTIREITDLARVTAVPAGIGGAVFDFRTGLSGLAFYISRENAGTYTIERWATTDEGLNWTSAIIATSASKLFRPASPLGNDGTIPVLWSLGTYTNYDNLSAAMKWA